MMISSQLGTKGRLGNHLFQIASLVGIAAANGQDWMIPPWKYAQYFQGEFETYDGPTAAFTEIPEPHFHYQEIELDAGHYDLKGWRQSEKYWNLQDGGYVDIQELFRFKLDFRKQLVKRFKGAFARPTIAISVRRGDFVNNPNYYQLPVSYYYLALLQEFPDWRNFNIVFFSDDLPYCKVHFEGMPNAYFADGFNDIEQLCLMANCDHFIVSNSTFSWWGAYLGETVGTKVVRPAHLFAGPTLGPNKTNDYWPDRWTVFEHEGKRLDLHDVTFTIPVYIDHKHRRQNLDLCIEMLRRDLMTHIIVCEQGSREVDQTKGGVFYMRHPEKYFHRTAMLNDMARAAVTPYVVNWDCDVFVPPFQLYLAAERLRAGDDMVYPYDGRFARVPRAWYSDLCKTLDLGIFQDTQFTGKSGRPVPTTSVGGAIMFNKESFFAGGGENEHMLSFGPEDWERNFRFKALGYTVTRVNGSLYHLDHWCGPNSSNRNPFFKINHRELDKVRAMTQEELERYVESWPWR